MNRLHRAKIACSVDGMDVAGDGCRMVKLPEGVWCKLDYQYGRFASAYMKDANGKNKNITQEVYPVVPFEIRSLDEVENASIECILVLKDEYAERANINAESMGDAAYDIIDSEDIPNIDWFRTMVYWIDQTDKNGTMDLSVLEGLDKIEILRSEAYDNNHKISDDICVMSKDGKYKRNYYGYEKSKQSKITNIHTKVGVDGVTIEVSLEDGTIIKDLDLYEVGLYKLRVGKIVNMRGNKLERRGL